MKRITPKPLLYTTHFLLCNFVLTHLADNNHRISQYALSPITTDNGKISDVFVISGTRKFPDIESKLWRGVMWSPSYYVGTAGNVSAETIQRYIREQQTEWKRGSSTG
jgi:REP element-mobilizing transposase RayT